MAEAKIWKPLDLIKVTADYLAGKSVPSPRLDAEILLCSVIGLERRVDLYAGFEREISGKELSAYRELVRRRSLREPVSRILGVRDFMGISFAVTPDVLSPRPETELLVETLLDTANPKKAVLPPEEESDFESPDPEIVEDDPATAAELERLLDSYAEDVDSDEEMDEPPPKPQPGAANRFVATRPSQTRPASGKAEPIAREGIRDEIRVLDLGTGSGCIAAAVAAHLPHAGVVAVDASPKALAVARKNAARAGLTGRIDFRQGDWFAACRQGEQYDYILSNPPYLVEGDAEIWPEVSRYDPPTALYGGKEGLDCYRRIIPDAPAWLAPDGWLLFEVGAGQARTVADMLRRRGFRLVDVVTDYGGVERVVKGMAPAL